MNSTGSQGCIHLLAPIFVSPSPHEGNHGWEVSDHGVVSGVYLSPGAAPVGEPVSILFYFLPKTTLVEDVRVVAEEWNRYQTCTYIWTI